MNYKVAITMNGERGICDICKSKNTKIFYRSTTTMFDRWENPLRELFRESWHCQRCGHYTIYEEGKELQTLETHLKSITHDNGQNLT